MKKILILALWPLGAFAADISGLPPAAEVEAVLHAHPAVRAAEAGIGVGEAQRDRLRAGPHEFSLRFESQRRRDRAADSSYPEQAVGIERAFRLPGKGAKDEALGNAALAEARTARDDALHEASRLLLKSWFDWQREQATAREWQAQSAILAEQHRAVTRRVALGDAARLEALLSEAQLTQAQAQLAQAETRSRLAADELRRQFPGLTLPAPGPEIQPATLPQPLEQWRDKIVERSHELALARAVTHRQMLGAQRADAERLPDPTLALRMARERDGQEHILGVQVAIPLPGKGRSAAARGAQAESAVAAAQEARVRAQVEGEARRTVAQAEAAHGHWQRLAAVAARMDDNARLLDRAWRLGEGQFSDLLTARRQAVEARLAAAQARLDAAEATCRVLLDAHELWAVDDGHDH